MYILNRCVLMLAVIIAISAYGVDVNLRPENNLMLLDPGIGSPFPAAAGQHQH